MSKEVIFRLRDDLDNSLGADIETLTFEWIDGQLYEIDLTATHVADMEIAMLPYVKAARPIKRRQAKRKPKVHDSTKHTTSWATEIHGWATDHGYDWDDQAQRKAVRAWAAQTGLYHARSGILPRRVMEAHYEARENGEAEWPPK